MEAFGLAPMQGPRLTVWRSSFAHPRSTHIQTVHTHWFNYRAEVFCPAVVAQGAGHADEEKRTIAEVNAAFAPALNLGGGGGAPNRYWDSDHAETSPDHDYDGDEPFFYLLRCQLVDLLHPNFIARYMKVGQFTAISVGAGIDRHNVAAIVPLGGEGKATLVLSVDKETYEQLGLEGRKSLFKQTNRYNISIDLCSPNFVPGRKFYERVRWCLSGRLSDIELLACWCVGGKTKKMEFARAVQAKPLKLKEANQLVKDLSVPVVDEALLADLFAPPGAQKREAHKPQPKPTTKGKEKAETDEHFIKIKVEEDDDDDSDEEEENDDDSEDEADRASSRKQMAQIEKVMMKMQLKNAARGTGAKRKKPSQTSDEARAFLHDVYEYLGLIAINATWGLSSTHKQEAHPFLSIDRFHSSAKAMHYEWRGLIPCAFIDGLLTKARKLVADKTVPWAAVAVTGFEDAPLSWGRNEHGAGDVPPGGENDYTFVVLPNDQYWLFVATNKNDTYSA